MRLRLWGAAGVLLMTLVGGTQSAEPASQLDRLLAQENAGRKVQEAPIVDDLGFLRRVFVDMVGRIPPEKEARQFLALPAKQRRAKAVGARGGRGAAPP